MRRRYSSQGSLASDARLLRESLPPRRVFEHYGFCPDRHGYLRCPFHHERTASLKVFPDGWHCFGCGAGGSVIDFTMKLFSLTFPQAVRRLQSDFGIGTAQGPGSGESLHLLDEARRKEAEESAARDAALRALAAEHLYWWEAQKYFAPDSPCAAGELHPLYCEALRRLPDLAWRLDQEVV